MRRMTGWMVVMLLMICGFACAEQMALPWSMAWETTPAEYVRALEANVGEGCTIAALRDGSVQIDLTVLRGDYSVSCRAIFDGGKGAGPGRVRNAGGAGGRAAAAFLGGH